jgi:hypothetical protein
VAKMMNLSDISNLRLINQQIAEKKFIKVKELVGLMGTIQAQDYNMTKWALCVRLSGTTEKAIEESFNKGEILRTHVLRPTLKYIYSNHQTRILKV